MARPSSSFRRGMAVCGAALVLLVLQSCLSLQVHVSFQTPTSGQVTINATTDRLAQGLQVAEGKDWVDFPQSSDDWQSLLSAVPGTSLVSWSGDEVDEGFHSVAVVSFSTARALEGLFVVFKQKLTLLQDNKGQWTLTFSPRVPRLTGGDPVTRKYWTALWGTESWTFGFQPPGRAESTKSFSLADLAGDRPPSDWVLRW